MTTTMNGVAGMTDTECVLATARAQLEQRLAELAPYVKEADDCRAALDRLYGEPPRKKRKIGAPNSRRDAILGALAANPNGLYARDIAQLTGLNTGNVANALWAFSKDRLVTYSTDDHNTRIWRIA